MKGYTEEEMRTAFYLGREVERMERGVPIFKIPTFNEYLRKFHES